MVRRKEDHEITKKSDLFGGKGEICFTHMATGEDLCNKGRLYAKLTVPEGASIGYHVHHGEIEGYHLVKGKAEFNDNGNIIELNEGDTAWIKPEQGHAIANIGKGDLQFIGLVLFAKEGD